MVQSGVRNPDLASVDLLTLQPVRLAAWEEMDERVVVTRPRPRVRGVRGVAELISFWLSVPRIRLDEVGSLTWTLLDGRRTVGEVATLVRQQFGDDAEPAEERVGQFVRILRHQGMLAYPGWDDLPTPPAGGGDGRRETEDGRRKAD